MTDDEVMDITPPSKKRESSPGRDSVQNIPMKPPWLSQWDKEVAFLVITVAVHEKEIELSRLRMSVHSNSRSKV